MGCRQSTLWVLKLSRVRLVELLCRHQYVLEGLNLQATYSIAKLTWF